MTRVNRECTDTLRQPLSLSLSLSLSCVARESGSASSYRRIRDGKITVRRHSTRAFVNPLAR